ncbi:unnamed protein product [Polarella glacialis]|uniref:Uncharacterized protein n=1 Tax=Polarella glacialis TaxID=89957 RepID=A0A813G3F0_POLGL|nr:unnamed protein product [Polarella glacialis]
MEFCSDTVDWNNGDICCDFEHFASGKYCRNADLFMGHGYTCASYGEFGTCANGSFKEEWKTFSGWEYNFPEDNCCYCGKQVGSPQPRPLPQPTWHQDGCRDTAGWTDGRNCCLGGRPDLCIPGSGYTCAYYDMKGWCAGGGFVGSNNAVSSSNSPRDNCCVCGKQESSSLAVEILLVLAVVVSSWASIRCRTRRAAKWNHREPVPASIQKKLAQLRQSIATVERESSSAQGEEQQQQQQQQQPQEPQNITRQSSLRKRLDAELAHAALACAGGPENWGRSPEQGREGLTFAVAFSWFKQPTGFP